MFELDKEYDRRLIGNSRPVKISVDGEAILSLMPGERYEAKVMTGKHKIKFSHKGGSTLTSMKISGNMYCYMYERRDEFEIRWNRGSNVFYHHEKGRVRPFQGGKGCLPGRRGDVREGQGGQGRG